MILVDSNSTCKPQKATYIALGSFDGLHMGHMALIEKAKVMAKEKDGLSMVYTFKNHPRAVINKAKAPKLIMDNETKMDILKNTGVDAVCFIEFDEKFMHMSPEEFIRQIKHQYNMKGIVVGFNFRFGHKNAGGAETLRQLASKYDYEAYIMKALKYEDEIVSSSKIRTLIAEDGNVEKANEMLTRPFMIKGQVIHGKKLGKTLGFPTANLKLYEDQLYPKTGVYYTNIIVENEVYKGITSIGYNPTVQGSELTFETYILNFQKEIYDKIIDVYFVNRIRDEKRFNSLEDLVRQLNLDREYAESKKIELQK